MSDVIIVVCPEEARALKIMACLADADLLVVGPAARASLALALAAQTPIGLAILSANLTGSRTGGELAEELMSTWGAPSILLDEQPDDRVWQAHGALARRVQEIIAPQL